MTWLFVKPRRVVGIVTVDGAHIPILAFSEFPSPRTGEVWCSFVRAADAELVVRPRRRIARLILEGEDDSWIRFA